MATRRSAAASRSGPSPWRSPPKARRARGEGRLPQRLARRVHGDQGPAAGQGAGEMGHRHGEMKTGAAPHRGRVPGVAFPGGDHAGGPGGGRHPHHGPQVAQMIGSVEQHHRLRPRGGEHRRRSHGGTASQGHHGSGRSRRIQAGELLGAHLGQQGGQVGNQVGGQARRQREDRRRVGGDRLEDRGPEAEGMLEGVEALEHDQGGVVTGALVAGGAAGHGPSLARRGPVPPAGRRR